MAMKLFRIMKARAGLFLTAGLAAGLFFLLPQAWPATSRFLIVWSLFVALYLVVVYRLTHGCRPDEIARRAPVLDEGETVILALSVLSAVASIAAIVVELVAAKGAGNLAALNIGLAVVTVGLSWAFVHTMFALKYAHEYYAPDDGGSPGGLQFPGAVEPLYGDFFYFSFVIGCACATADVNITSREIRTVALVHGTIAFFFNTSILALTINIAAGLVGG